MEKRPNNLSSGIVRAVPPLTAGGSGGESSCAGTQLPDWGKMGGDEPWCRLSLVTAGIVTGHCRYCHWQGNFWGFWFKTKAFKAHQIVPVWAWHQWRQLLHRWMYQ